MSNEEQQESRRSDRVLEELELRALQEAGACAQPGQDRVVPLQGLLPERFSDWRILGLVAADGVVLVDAEQKE